MFASERIETLFLEASRTFLEETHLSIISYSVVDLLLSAKGPVKYGSENRNKGMETLATDVETATGLKANLMFRSEGHLHDCLQTFMDAYLDAMDGICYTDKPETKTTKTTSVDSTM